MTLTPSSHLYRKRALPGVGEQGKIVFAGQSQRGEGGVDEAQHFRIPFHRRSTS